MTMRKTKATADTGEEGYILIAVLFLVVIMLIGLAVAAPKVATQIRRDKESELYHRGMQYTRAIKLYYKKFGRYPSSMDQLENTNNIRFLRRRYNDPFTGKPDWKLIHLGEAKVAQTGLFGQPLAGTGATGAAGVGNTGQANSGFNNATQGTSNSGGPSFGNSFSNGGGTGSGFGGGTGTGFSGIGQSNQQGPIGQGTTSPGPSTDTSGGVSGADATSTNTGTGGATGLGNSTLTSTNGSPIGSAGPIMGVSSILTKESIREFKKQKHYNEWEFVYNPQTDMGGLGGNTGQGIVGQNGNTTNGFGTSFGSNQGSSFGNNTSFGNNPGSGGNSGSGFGSSSNGSTGNNGGTSPNPGGNGSPNGGSPTDPNNPAPSNPNQPPPN